MNRYDKDDDENYGWLMFTPIAYSHDRSREELIDRFRDRISAEQRTDGTQRRSLPLSLLH